MKLELHLIPSTSYYINLRNSIGSLWGKLSKEIRTEHNFTCEHCNVKKIPKNIHLHEHWKFYEEQQVQKLTGFECVCDVCHSVHHWGISLIQNKDMNFLERHACKINNCSVEEWRIYVNLCFVEWRRRSEVNWKIDMSYVNNFRIDLI